MKCESCGKDLVLPSYLSDTFQYTDALGISFCGYYNGYFDNLGRDKDDLTCYICSDCGDKLLTDNPWMEKIIFDEKVSNFSEEVSRRLIERVELNKEFQEFLAARKALEETLNDTNS